MRNKVVLLSVILLLAPPIIDETVEGVKEKYLGGGEKSKQLASLYKQIALRNGCKYLDVSKLVFPSKKDGYHLEQEQHKIIADKLNALIKESFVF